MLALPHTGRASGGCNVCTCLMSKQICTYMGQSLHYSTLAVIADLAVVAIASQGTTLLITGTRHSTTGSGNSVMWQCTKNIHIIT